MKRSEMIGTLDDVAVFLRDIHDGGKDGETVFGEYASKVASVRDALRAERSTRREKRAVKKEGTK